MSAKRQCILFGQLVPRPNLNSSFFTKLSQFEPRKVTPLHCMSRYLYASPKIQFSVRNNLNQNLTRGATVT